MAEIADRQEGMAWAATSARKRAAPGSGARGQRLRWLTAGLAVVLSLCAAGLGTVPRVAGLTELAYSPNPYLVPSHALLLYVWTPVVALSGSVAILAPGMLLALAIGGGRLGFLALLLQGLALTVVGVTAAAEIADAAAGPVTGGAFLALLAALTAAALLAVTWADRRGRVNWRVAEGRGIDLAIMLAVPLATLLTMTPKFYWESFNGDGAGIHTAARLLIHTPLPFWPPGPDRIGYPSISVLLEVFANSWFVRLFGEVPIASRLPVLAGLGLLAGAVLGLIRLGAGGRTGARSAVAVAAALLLYAWVLAFQPTYDPYFADIASPMSREPLAMLAILGVIAFWADWQPRWFAAFVLLLLLALPSGPVLIAFWFAAVTVTTSPRPWGRLAIGALALIAALAICKLVPAILSARGLIDGWDEFSTQHLARRLRFVTLFEFERLAWWILACGIVPALSLLAWRAQDPLTRAVALLAVAYALFFTVQAYRVLPHHLAPVMILPLLVFWRLGPVRRHPGAAMVLALAGVAVAALLARPASLAPHMMGREFGAAIEIAYSRPDAFDIEELNSIRVLLERAFPLSYEEGAGERTYLGAPWAWLEHAQDPKRPDQPIHYRILQRDNATRPGEVTIAEHRGYRLVATSTATHEAILAQGSTVRSMNDLFYVRRDSLFGRGARGGPRPVWDLAKLAGLR